MTHSRNKGRNAERDVELRFQAAGHGTERNLGGRLQIAGDLVVYDVEPRPLAVEVRRREQLLVPGWCAEHEAATPERFVPVLTYRRNREPWRASLLLDDLIDLIGGSTA